MRAGSTYTHPCMLGGDLLRTTWLEQMIGIFPDCFWYNAIWRHKEIRWSVCTECIWLQISPNGRLVSTLHWKLYVTPWSLILLEEITVPLLMKKFPYVMHRIHNGPPLVRSWARWMYSTSSYPISLRSLLVLVLHQRLDLSERPFSFNFTHQNLTSERLWMTDTCFSTTAALWLANSASCLRIVTDWINMQRVLYLASSST